MGGYKREGGVGCQTFLWCQPDITRIESAFTERNGPFPLAAFPVGTTSAFFALCCFRVYGFELHCHGPCTLIRIFCLQNLLDATRKKKALYY